MISIRSRLSWHFGALLAMMAMVWMTGCASQPAPASPLIRADAAPAASLHTPSPTRANATVRSPFRAVNTRPLATPTTPPSQPAGETTEILRRLKEEKTATPAPTPPIVRRSGRIDEIGPVPVATIAPLPVGGGLPPVRLQIPALNLDAPVQRMGWKRVNGVSQWDVVDDAAGHHFNSAFPGEPGNVVLSGHNNIAGAIFAGVCVIGQPGVDFGLGDAMILVDSSGRRFSYQVNGWHRMKEKNASIATRQDNAAYLQQTDAAQLTLITCWPPWSNTHRVVVTGALTEMTSARTSQAQD